jgi:hypothetical protein
MRLEDRDGASVDGSAVIAESTVQPTLIAEALPTYAAGRAG